MWAYVIKNMAMQTKRDSFKIGIRAMQGYRMQAEIFRNGNTVGGTAVIVQLAGVTDDRFYNRIQRCHRLPW